ncbi:hypothetical protein Zm00014a_043403 [Zea mays]|jgi:hypothetical protein|uniref:Uncharacterized protein n=1 Tax=Zea mays TaxID=4577 RepID=A0A3L6EYA7_MAIZE|nr:hypothetical protein Zm00014a_043403 [Zea mays]
MRRGSGAAAAGLLWHYVEHAEGTTQGRSTWLRELASRLLTGRALGKQTPWEVICCCGLVPEMEELANLGSGSGGTSLDLEQGARAWGSRGTLRVNERVERGPELVLTRGPGIGGGKARWRPVEDVGRRVERVDDALLREGTDAMDAGLERRARRRSS